MKWIKKTLIIVFFSATLIFSSTVLADADKTALESARENVNQAILDQVGGIYETDSYAAFSDGLTALGGMVAVDAMIADILALQEDVDQMTLDLNQLLGGLVTKITYNIANSKYFDESIRSLVTYTNRSIILFNLELDRIKALLDEPTSGEVLIYSLIADIDASSILLIPLGDKTDLIIKYNQAEAIYLDGSGYIPSTYSIFMEVYDEIDTTLLASIGFSKLEVINSADASQPEVDETLAEIESALGLLIESPDKSTLIQSYDDAVSQDFSIYTLDSRNSFIAELTPINDVIIDPEALLADVQQAEIDLNSLYLTLVLKGDKSVLQASIDELNGFEYTLYTPASVSLFQTELARIINLMNSENITIPTMSVLEQDFEDAFDLLVTRADKNDLNIYNNQAIVAYYEEKNLYTASSYALFKIAVLEYGTYLYVNQVLSNNDALQAEVDLLADKILSALSLLDELVDNSNLLSIYTSSGIIEDSDYTPESINEFNTERERLYAIIKGKELSQTVYDQVLIDLENSFDLLHLRADKSGLIELYASLVDKKQESYSISSYANFSNAMVLASQIILNENATQNTVDSGIQALQGAVTSLQPRAGEISINANSTPFNINSFVTTGTANIVSYESSDETILTIDNAGNVTGHAFGAASIKILLSNGVEETLYFLVKANVKTVTLILAITFPVLSVSLGFGMLYLRPKHLSFLKKMMFWKKR